MNLKDMTDALLFWISQKVGVTLPLIMTLIVGLTLCVAAVTALWTRRLRVAPALMILLTGALLVLISLDTRILHGLVATGYLTRIRMLMGLLSIVVAAVTFEAVRRSQLKERYAILWLFTGGVILLCAFFPAILDFMTSLLGMQYVTAVGVVVFVFVLMVLFHVSLAISNIQRDETATAQRCALLEAKVDRLATELATLQGREAIPIPIPAPAPIPVIQTAAGARNVCQQRSLRGFVVGVPVLIAAFGLAVLWSGLRTPQAMVGDEVTHYYMLRHQAHVLPEATFQAIIPTGWGAPHVRRYPHPHLWHYAGAYLYRAIPAFATIQGYQTLFLIQLLVAAFFLIRRRPGASTTAILLYLLLLASLPVTLMFSMTFYQDVPLTAQVVTAFCLLDRRRWIWATVFMMLALGIKVTAFLFVPAFLGFLIVRKLEETKTASRRGVRFRRVAFPVLIAGTMLWIPMHAYHRLLDGEYYPFLQVRSVVKRVAQTIDRPEPPVRVAPPAATAAADPVSRPISRYEAEIIANHPGDLRLPVNWMLYGGMLIWWVMAMGLARRLAMWRKPALTRKMLVDQWPVWVGLSYLLPAAYLLKTAPDARFFLPALPFILLPFVLSAARLPRQRIWMSLLTALAIAQSGFVLATAVQLRQVTPELKAGMAFLGDHPPQHNRVFMYPEGNYRLFPVEHDWYLGYRLRDFWRADNDQRLQLLARRRIGAIVIKKHLVRPVDENITNLGVYPDYFVEQIEADARFRKIFDNTAVTIYEFNGPATMTVE